MSLQDGQMRNDTLYVTSDIALAAYLLMRGFTLLGAIDTGEKRKGFGLTHTDPEIISTMFITIQSMSDEFENMFLPLPHDKNARVNFRVYQRKIKELHHSLDEPVRRET